MDKPLDGLLVVDFSQFLSGPSATLRMADLGARVIKIERPDGGDLGRQLYISNLELDGDSTLFHSINRNKESFAADLKKEEDRRQVRELLKRADVMVQNFRPGVIEKLGLDYESVKEINPRIVYGEVTGYGQKGPWRNKPGQDLLVQSLSGLPWLNGDADQPPVPFGLAVVDLFAGAHLVQGILAALIRRGIRGVGGKVEVSLMESILDAQFEVFTTYLNNGHQLPQRSSVNNAHAFLGAPYGIYTTSNGFIALAMGSLSRLGELLGSSDLLSFGDKDIFEHRERIKQILSEFLKQQPTEHWLAILEPADIWCSDVFDWDRLFAHDGFKALEMVQRVTRRDGVELDTTRCPIRLDGNILTNSKGAPRLGANTEKIRKEFSLT
ncbi:MAG TPA: CaiB/BaiF CoA-transferase family protein [Terriglobales bacterium]|nr:CaiB/BaiF CoA-transferase family protein [Terriglobales bacterium]